MARTIQASHVWAIAYIDKDGLENIEAQLRKYPVLRGVEHYTPTIKILRKQFKQKQKFEEIPALFNYGFFKVSSEQYNEYFLDLLKSQLKPFIFDWVKDHAREYHNGSIIDEEEKTIKRFQDCRVAYATQREIDHLKNFNFQDGIYTAEEIDSLMVGALITLICYPFEGYVAKILDVDKKRRKVLVELQIMATEDGSTERIAKDVRIGFDHVLYTIYRGEGYNENKMKEKHLEDSKMGANKKMNQLNHKSYLADEHT